MKNKINQYYEHIKKEWWLYLILLVYIILVGIIIYYHEPWADEAQAWLIARDSNLFEMLFNYLRYIGHPSLWYLILIIPAKLNFPYFTINIVSGIIATIGVYVFLRYSPFPKIIKILFPFSFFIFYQYAVVARSYVLLPLLIFLIAKVYKDKTKKIYLFTLLLVLLANVCVHSFLIAVPLFLLHSIDVFKGWNNLDKKLRIKQIKAGIIFVFVIGLIIIQLWPPKDLNWVTNYNFSFSHFLKLSPNIINWAMTGVMWLTSVVLIISLFWFWRKRALLLYLIPTLAILSFFSIVSYKGWHEGILILVWIFAMWISFERDNIEKTKSKFLRTLAILSLIIFLSFHIFWSFKTSINDINGTYSAGKSIASYIKTNQLEDKKIYATTFWSISILPYLDDVIFDNYYHPEKPSRHLWLKWGERMENYDIILKDQPDLIIFGRPSSKLKEIPGYKFEGIFEGNIYWKSKIYERNNFALFRKEEN